MCGRYSLVLNVEKLKQQFARELQLPNQGLLKNYNVAPTQQGIVITDSDPNKLSTLRWGLVPFWAKDLKIGAKMINARREGIADKPSFRKPIRESRCLVLADSFYEWQRQGKSKKPHRILPVDESLLVMAGIWEQWQPPAPDDAPIYTFSIITGAPNAEMRPIHDRMPMLLMDPEAQNTWLNKNTKLETVLDLLATPSDGTLKYYQVSPLVGSVKNNGEQLHKLADDWPKGQLSLGFD